MTWARTSWSITGCTAPPTSKPGILIAPVGQQHDVIVIEPLDVAGLGLDHDRPVNTGLLLKPGMAVIPAGTTLMDGEAVDIGLARRNPGKTETRHAVHRRWRADAVPKSAPDSQRGER